MDEDTIILILKSVSISTIITVVISYLTLKRTETLKADIKRRFDVYSQMQMTELSWKKETANILGQIYINLNRTRLAFERKVDSYDKYREEEIFYNSNKFVRDLILNNGHHIPPDLLDEASKLVEHYDAWLVKYNKVRIINQDSSTKHIYVGPDGYRFPFDAEEKFKEKYGEVFKSISELSSI